MNIYKKSNIGELIKDNSYVGRGIVIGTSHDGKKAVTAYFIMGRSENSRNRIFTVENDTVKTKPYDESKVKDPSLIIYSAIKNFGDNLIVTNGDQTDTIFDQLSKGKSFKQALESREFEPDSPNFTPRISGILYFKDCKYSYEMSILKSIDEGGNDCCRYTFSYPSYKGLGHFIHTYVEDGSPIPTFQGEPERIDIPDSIDEFTDDLWNNLNQDNKISLYVRYTDIETNRYEHRLINKFN